MHCPKTGFLCCRFFSWPPCSFPFPWRPSSLTTAFPTNLTLCGEPVPLHDRKFWEMMDREFTLAVYDQAQVFLLLKRSTRFFPFIESQLKAKGMPDDLKYLMVAESAMRPVVFSNKGAAGHWQFMEKTGKRFNLRKNSQIDERLDLAKSTEAALSYLKCAL